MESFLERNRLPVLFIWPRLYRRNACHVAPISANQASEHEGS